MATFPSRIRLQRDYERARDARIAQLNNRKPGEPIPDAEDIPALVKSLAKSNAGRAAQRNGATFEDRCITWALQAGIHLFKIPSGAKWGAGGVAYPVKTPFDIIGAIPAMAGRSIAFDAKSVSENSKHQSIKIGTNLVPLHQVASLKSMGEAGAIAGLLVSCGPRRDVRWLSHRYLKIGVSYALPWDSPDWKILSGIAEPIGFARLLESA